MGTMAGAVGSGVFDQWTERRQPVISGMDVYRVRDGVYLAFHNVNGVRESITGSLQEVIDAMKVLVVTARIES
jgi:hypothetical protein